MNIWGPASKLSYRFKARRKALTLSYIETVTQSERSKSSNTFIDVAVGHFASFNFYILTEIVLFSAPLVHSPYRRCEKKPFLKFSNVIRTGKPTYMQIKERTNWLRQNPIPWFHSSQSHVLKTPVKRSQHFFQHAFNICWEHVEALWHSQRRREVLRHVE